MPVATQARKKNKKIIVGTRESHVTIARSELVLIVMHCVLLALADNTNATLYVTLMP